MFVQGADNKEVIIDRPIGLATNYETYQRHRQSNQTIVKAGGVNAGGPMKSPDAFLHSEKNHKLKFGKATTATALCLVSNKNNVHTEKMKLSSVKPRCSKNNRINSNIFNKNKRSYQRIFFQCSYLLQIECKREHTHSRGVKRSGWLVGRDIYRYIVPFSMLSSAYQRGICFMGCLPGRWFGSAATAAPQCPGRGHAPAEPPPDSVAQCHPSVWRSLS